MPPRHGVQDFSASVVVIVYPPCKVPLSTARNDITPMIEGISAITLATHDMARAVRFYTTLGFELMRGGEDAIISTFRAGTGYLNLIAQPKQRQWTWWGR